MSATGIEPAAGSGRPVSNFDLYCEGDIDPMQNKRIRVLIDSERDYLVYLDDDYIVQWSLFESRKLAPEFGDIANRVAELMTLSMVLLEQDGSTVKPFRCLLAEAMARIIGDNDREKAQKAIEIAEAFLMDRSLERARRWYFEAALFSAGISFLLAGLLWFFRDAVISKLGQNAFEVLLGGFFGGIGAFTAMLRRLRTTDMNASAGAHLHRLEGAGRVVVGFTAALFIALAIKANILLGVTKTSDHSLALLLVVCFVAGWSEKLMPSLVSRFESSVVGKDKVEAPNKQPDRSGEQA